MCARKSRKWSYRRPLRVVESTVRHPDELRRVSKRQRTKQQRVYDAIDGRAGADAKPGDQHYEGCEPGFAFHGSKGISQVLREIAEPARNPCGTCFFLCLCHIAEFSPCRAKRFAVRHTLLNEFVRESFDMEFDLRAAADAVRHVAASTVTVVEAVSFESESHDAGYSAGLTAVPVGLGTEVLAPLWRERVKPCAAIVD